MTEARAPRSKTLAAWLALTLGVWGIHRLYLHGLSDRWAWAHVPPTAAGLLGVLRLRELGQDDALSSLLAPAMGLMIAVAALATLVFALTPDEKWDARYNGGHAVNTTGWSPVLAAIAALMIGGAALMGSIAYGGQKFFEWQLESSRAQNSMWPTP